MRKYTLGMLFLFISVFLYSNPLSGLSFADRGIPIKTRYSFNNEEMTVSKTGKEVENTVYSYQLVLRNGIYFIEYGENFDNYYLAIFNNFFLILYKDDGQPVFIGGNNRSPDVLFFNEKLAQTSSSLTECINGKKITYPNKNLGFVSIPFPWVEGRTDDGVGEKISIGSNPGNGGNIFYISNGYVSFNRSDLYLKNNRIKELLVKNVKTGKSWIIKLDDTPNLQTLSIRNNKEYCVVELEIISVYKGTMYHDTCLNFIGMQPFYEEKLSYDFNIDIWE